MTLAAGVMLGRYRIEDLAGAGGMGEVYRAYDTRLDRTVAIKVLPEAVAGDAGRRERFAREALAIARITHPHICTLYEFDSATLRAGAPAVDFLAMEYLDGRTLAAALAGSSGLPLPDALRLAIQIADALAAAHGQGIVHRDLKPGNIMLTRGGSGRPDSHVKLLDFGLAKLRAPGQDPASQAAPDTAHLGGRSAVFGTLPYVAPERFEGREADQRADLFAFGAIVYEMFAGRPAFAGDSQPALIASLMTCEPPPLSSLNPLVPHALDRVVAKCLEKDPGSRWRDAQDLANELRWIAEDSGARLVVPAPPARVRSNPPIGAVVVAAGVVAAGLWWFAAAPALVLPPMRTIPLTTFPGSEFDPALSPDGERVAFTWTGPAGDGTYDLYVKQVEGGTPQLLHDTAGEVFTPAWSPDGRQVAFIAHLDVPVDEPSDGLFVVPSFGGAARRLDTFRHDGSEHHGLSWSPDGERLAIGHRETRGSASAIWLFSIADGQRRRLTHPPTASIGDSFPRFSPDGRTVAFRRSSELLDRQDIYLVAAAGGEARRLTHRQSPVTGFDWSSNDTLVFSAVLLGAERPDGLWQTAISGGEPEPLAVGEAGRYPAVSRHGKRLAYLRRTERASIWRAGGPRALPEERTPRELIASTSWDGAASYSPDGSQIAFSSSRSGYLEIWVAASDGSSPRQHTFLKQYAYGPHWSPDGRYISFTSNAANNPVVYVVSAAGGIPRPVNVGTSNDLAAGWSQDGQSVYVRSNRGGSIELWRVPLDGSPPEQMTFGGGHQGMQSADGTLYFTRRSVNQDGPLGVWKRSSSDPQPALVVPFGYARMWVLLDSGICYLRRPKEGPPVIEYYDFGTQTTRVVAEPGPSATGWFMSGTPDGRWITYDVNESEHDIMLVENFH